MNNTTVVIALPMHAEFLANCCIALIGESSEEFPLAENAALRLTSQIMEDMQDGIANLLTPQEGVELWLVALDNETGTPVGGVQYQCGHAPLPYDGVFAYAAKLYVLPEWRGGKVGRQLIQKAINLARSHGATYGVVKASSERLQQRYARQFGFVPSDREMFIKLGG